MLLYIVRHGIAVDVGENNVSSDEERMLSVEGIHRTKMVAKGLLSMGIRPERIISSPLCRAFETAEIIEKELKRDIRIETLEPLSPDGSIEQTTKWLAQQQPEAMLLVGHMPNLNRLASRLLVGDNSLNLLFKKAAACCISFPGTITPGSGGLEWLIQPKQLRHLGSAK